jgi:hypothetical protein
LQKKWKIRKTEKEKEKNKEKERKAGGNDSAQLRIYPTAHPGSNRSGTLAPLLPLTALAHMSSPSSRQTPLPARCLLWPSDASPNSAQTLTPSARQVLYK